jgi:hypothetical protein
LPSREALVVDANAYLALGVLLGFVYMLAVAAIVVLSSRRRRNDPSSLGIIRRSIADVQQELQRTEKQIWEYGRQEEGRSRYWRNTFLDTAVKAAGVLRSCWQEQEQDETARTIYNTLLTGLTSAGFEEIAPGVGDRIQEDDERFRFNERDGQPPYQIKRVLYPGYYFRVRVSEPESSQERILLEQAVVDVETVSAVSDDRRQ